MGRIRKHVVEVQNVAVTATYAAPVIQGVISAVLNPDYFTNTFQVMAESQVFAVDIQLDMNVNTQAALTLVEMDWALFFNIDGAQTPPTLNNVGNSHLKNQILHQDHAMFLVPPAAQFGSHYAAVFRTHVRLPKAWSRFQDGDKLQLIFASSAAGAICNVTGRVIYKEYYAS